MARLCLLILALFPQAGVDIFTRLWEMFVGSKDDKSYFDLDIP